VTVSTATQLFTVAERTAIRGLRVATERARLRGRRIVDGWAAAGPGAACRGTVTDESSARAALAAALSGADLLVEATATIEVVDRLCDDLRRLGTVDHRAGEPTDSGPLDDLADDEIALLGLLAGGLSLGAAATRLRVSRRTADRRLADAKQRLGARGTAEAVAILRGH
jgi:DNA-binding NarL/FixJ family response regulator